LRPDVNAVIHAHPPICIAYTVAGIPIDTFLLPEVVVTLGSLPTSPYATPTTREVPDSIRDYIQHSDAVMLARHGAVTVGGTLGDAFKILEKMEASARIGLYARLLGGAVPFSPEETAKLLGLRPGWGVERRTASPTDFTSVRLSTSAPEPDDLPRPNDRLVTGMSERRLRAVIEEAVRAALRGEVDPDRPRAP
jgi:L-fuculose-phosphate aldolase